MFRFSKCFDYTKYRLHSESAKKYLCNLCNTTFLCMQYNVYFLKEILLYGNKLKKNT